MIYDLEHDSIPPCLLSSVEINTINTDCQSVRMPTPTPCLTHFTLTDCIPSPLWDLAITRAGPRHLMILLPWSPKGGKTDMCLLRAQLGLSLNRHFHYAHALDISNFRATLAFPYYMELL